VVVQDRCYKGGTGPADYFVFLSKWECQLSLGNRVFVVLHKGIISAVKRVYVIVILMDRLCVILNVHAPFKDKCDDTKHNLYEESVSVFEQFSNLSSSSSSPVALQSLKEAWPPHDEWTSGLPVAKASTYTGQHNATQEDEDKHPRLK
jgi:hypothetical protein